MTVELGLDFFVGDGDAVVFGEFESVGVFFGLFQSGALVLLAEICDGAADVNLTGLAFDGSNTATIEHEVVGKTDCPAVDGGDRSGDNLGDAEKHVAVHIEAVKSEPAADKNDTDNDSGDENGIDDDAVLSELQRVFELASSGKNLLATLVDLLLLGLFGVFFLEQFHIYIW